MRTCQVGFSATLIGKVVNRTQIILSSADPQRVEFIHDTDGKPKIYTMFQTLQNMRDIILSGSPAALESRRSTLIDENVNNFLLKKGL